MGNQLRDNEGRFKRGRKRVSVPSPAEISSPAETPAGFSDDKGLLDMTYEKFREVVPASGSVFTEDLTLAPE